MILNLPPQTAYMIDRIAMQQGQSVEQFILATVDEKILQIATAPANQDAMVELESEIAS